MRKIVLLVLAMLLLAVPAFAQGMMPEKTIAEIVVEAAGAETPEFSTLLAAVSAADPAVLEALSNPESELTVFAPTDAAFAALAEALGQEAFNGVLADQAALTGILLFHVTGSKVMSADVVAALEANDGAFAVPSLQGQYINITSDDMGVYINGAKLNLDMVDIEATNGVIHVIESVILPESRTIAEIVVEAAGAETPEFSTLLAAVSAADPAVLETLSNAEAELTVFAPTDAAFAALAEALGEEAFNGVLADQAALTNILLYHVVPGIVRSGDLGALLEEHMSMSEAPLMVDTALEGKQVSFMVAEDGSVKINDATIIITDIDAANGVIHVIDAVILPPGE